eukprot:16447048-Heterocapsa_arctica.AAC.1
MPRGPGRPGDHRGGRRGRKRPARLQGAPHRITNNKRIIRLSFFDKQHSFWTFGVRRLSGHALAVAIGLATTV